MKSTLGTDSRVARFGPTTPTRAGRLPDASVDPTEARNDILGCFGRSHRSAQSDRPTLRIDQRMPRKVSGTFSRPVNRSC